MEIFPSIIEICAATANALTAVNSTENLSIFDPVSPVSDLPPRVGTLQLQFIITDIQGNLINDDTILTTSQFTDITLDEIGTWNFQYTLKGAPQPPLSFEVLPKASLLGTYWHLWFFLIFGLIFIILREKLANIHARRYPSLLRNKKLWQKQ